MGVSRTVSSLRPPHARVSWLAGVGAAPLVDRIAGSTREMGAVPSVQLAVSSSVLGSREGPGVAAVLPVLAAVARSEEVSRSGRHEAGESSTRRCPEPLSQPDAARGVCSRVPSGLRTTHVSPTRLRRWRPSCNRMWWRWHSRARLSALVGPPSAQCFTWWASQREGGASQPGHTQPPSRAMRTQRNASLTRRVRRPTSMTRPLPLSGGGDDLGVAGQTPHGGRAEALSAVGDASALEPIA